MNNFKDNHIALLTIANTAGIVGLGFYNVKKINEINNRLFEINEDLNKIKKGFMENNRRSNIAFNKLNQKIENNINNVRLQVKDIEEQKVTELVPTQSDDVSNAMSALLQ